MEQIFLHATIDMYAIHKMHFFLELKKIQFSSKTMVPSPFQKVDYCPILLPFCQGNNLLSRVIFIFSQQRMEPNQPIFLCKRHAPMSKHFFFEVKRCQILRQSNFFSRKRYATIDMNAIHVMHFFLEFKKYQFFRLSRLFFIEAMQHYYALHVIFFFL